MPRPRNRTLSHDAVKAWVDSWDTPDELPQPRTASQRRAAANDRHRAAGGGIRQYRLSATSIATLADLRRRWAMPSDTSVIEALLADAATCPKTPA